MTHIYDIYSKGIKNKLKNYFCAWLPNSRLELGDFGTLNGCLFERAGSLKELGVEFTTSTNKKPSPLELISDAGVTVATKLAGGTDARFTHTPATEVGIKIEFGKRGAFVVQSPATFEQTIGDLLLTQHKIATKYKSGDWKKEWVVIIRIVTAPSATFIICDSQDASMELSCSSNGFLGIQDIGKLGTNLSIRHMRGDIIKFIPAQNVSPFFQLGQLRANIMGEKFKTKSAINSGEDEFSLKMILDA